MTGKDEIAFSGSAWTGQKVGRQDCKSPYNGSILLPASRGYVGRKGWRRGSRPAEDEDLALAGPLCYKARPY